MISINLITPVHTDALIPTVTAPSEIILYYRLNHSFCVVGLTPGKSLVNTEELERMHQNSHEGESRVPYKLTSNPRRVHYYKHTSLTRK
jgi:hypothetical protein